MSLTKKDLINKYSNIFELIQLNLFNQQLIKLEPNVFHGLNRLKIIELSNNKIEELDKDLFKKYNSL
jgi:Leucine-rich repeat (LRR) protein